jgi:hypothetical protein
VSGPPGIFIGIPSLGMISIDWHRNFTIIVPNHLPIGFSWKTWYVVKRKVADARQILAEKALEVGAKYVLFIDDDVIIPIETIKELHAMNKDVALGLYWAKCNTIQPLIFNKDYENDGYWHDYPRNQVVQVFGGGLGCALIKTDVFRELQKKGESIWFKEEFPVVTEFGPEVHKGTEDIYFYGLCRKYGIPVFMNTGIKCLHYSSSEDKYYPADDIFMNN